MKQIPFTESFALNIALRIIALVVVIAGMSIWMRLAPEQSVIWIWLPGLVLIFALGWNLYHYVSDTNRRLTRFLESVRYSDFAVRFSDGSGKGASFVQMNQQFNEVLEAFRQTRAEKEANLLFMNAIVQHLSAGIMAFDMQNSLLISNNSAFQLLGVYRFTRIMDLPESHYELVQFVENLKSKGKMLYQPETGRQISVQGVVLSLQGRTVRLITLQNIHNELQRKEVDAWRDLTRVLRHEIMNSVTPIVTIVETMKDIVHTDLKPSEATADLEEALEVVASRSRSLMDFVEAYRTFSALPNPRLENVSVKKLLENVSALVAADMKQQGVQLDQSCESPENTFVLADPGQIEMVLINLLKNAREALTETNHARITLECGSDQRGGIFIQVTDNGPGIGPELQEEIFIPFFTTKQTGTGVGLSISKQIMQLHGGDLSVVSSVGKGCRFIMAFQ